MSFPDRFVPLPFRIDLNPIDEFDFDDILSASRGSKRRADYAYRGKRNFNSREISGLSGDAHRAKGNSSSREIGGLKRRGLPPNEEIQEQIQRQLRRRVRPMRRSKNKYQDGFDGDVHQPKQHSRPRDNHYVSAFDGHVNRTAEHLKRPRLDEEKFYGDVIPSISITGGDTTTNPSAAISSAHPKFLAAVDDTKWR